MNKFLPLILSTLFFCSCVGTIEETNFETTEVVSDKIEYQNYEGIDEVVAISHDKVEVYFFELEGIPADKVVYQIYYDGAETPIYLPGGSMKPRADGRLYYQVSGLNPNEEYYFQVQALNLLTDNFSLNDKKLSAKTFANRTASFEGVQSVIHQPGPDGLNFIKVVWSPAEKGSTGFVPLPSDAVKYEVTVLSSDRILSDFDNTELSNDDRKILYFSANNSYGVVGGLIPGQTYFVRVRAIHQEYSSKSTIEGYKHEENNKYVAITMLTSDLGKVDFDSDSLVIDRPDGAEGLTSLNAVWGFPTGGAYNHFRLYYAGELNDPNNISLLEETILNINPSSGCDDTSEYFCRKVQFSTNSFQALDLITNWRYYFIVYVCFDETCQESKASVVRSNITIGDTATFAGITGYELGSTFDTLNTITLKVNPPNLDGGILDGIIYYHDVANGQNNLVPLNPTPEMPASNSTSDLEMLPYNFEEDSEVKLVGVDVEALIGHYLNPSSVPAIPYYFYYRRYTIAEGVNQDDTEASPFIAIPKLEVVREYSGVTSCAIKPAYTSINWAVPEKGIFTHYKLSIYRNDILLEEKYISRHSTSFESVGYYASIYENSSDVLKASVIPVIIYGPVEIDPSEMENLAEIKSVCTQN